MIPGNFSSVRIAWFLKIRSAASWLISGCATNFAFRIPLTFLEHFGMALDRLPVAFLSAKCTWRETPIRLQDNQHVHTACPHRVETLRGVQETRLFHRTHQTWFHRIGLLLAMHFYHGSWGPNPWLSVSSWVLGSQSLAVLLSSRPFGTCLIHHIQWFQCKLLPKSRLSTHPRNQLNSDVTCFRNTQASREKRNHHLQEHITASRHHLPRRNKNVHCFVDVLVCGTSTVLMTSGYHETSSRASS